MSSILTSKLLVWCLVSFEVGFLALRNLLNNFTFVFATSASFCRAIMITVLFVCVACKLLSRLFPFCLHGLMSLIPRMLVHHLFLFTCFWALLQDKHHQQVSFLTPNALALGSCSSHFWFPVFSTGWPYPIFQLSLCSFLLPLIKGCLQGLALLPSLCFEQQYLFFMEWHISSLIKVT